MIWFVALALPLLADGQLPVVDAAPARLTQLTELAALPATPNSTEFAGEKVLGLGSWEVVGADLSSVTVLARTGSDGLADPAYIDLDDAETRLVLHRMSADLEQEPISQELAVSGRGTGPVLYWAGDVDGDNLTDLVLDTDPDYASERLVLLLSSAAGEGELVGEAIVIEGPGC